MRVYQKRNRRKLVRTKYEELVDHRDNARRSNFRSMAKAATGGGAPASTAAARYSRRHQIFVPLWSQLRRQGRFVDIWLDAISQAR